MIRLFLALTTLLAQWLVTLEGSWPGDYLGKLLTHVGIESSVLFVSALLAGAAVFWLHRQEHIGGWTTGLKQILIGLLIILLLHSAVIGAVTSVLAGSTGKPEGSYAMLGLMVAMVALGPWLEAAILIGNVLLVVGVLRYLRGPVLEPEPAPRRRSATPQRSHGPGRTPTRATAQPLKR
jgi:hypothetical protein